MAATRRIVQKRSVTVAGHRTSVTLEEPFWISLKEIADMRKKSINALIAEIDRSGDAENLSSAIRVFVLSYYKGRSTGLA